MLHLQEQGRTCTKCGLAKEADAFRKNGLMTDGQVRRRSICIECGSGKKFLEATERTCAACKKTKPIEEFPHQAVSYCRVCNNEKTYAYRRGPGRAAHNYRMNKYVKDKWANDPVYREKTKARAAVMYALKTGVLVRPELCPTCGRKARLQGHHHKGYAQENWLSVVWLCARCHRKEEAHA